MHLDGARPYFLYLIIAAALVPIYWNVQKFILAASPRAASSILSAQAISSGYAAIASELFPGEIRAAAMGLSYNIPIRGLLPWRPLPWERWPSAMASAQPFFCKRARS